MSYDNAVVPQALFSLFDTAFPLTCAKITAVTSPHRRHNHATAPRCRFPWPLILSPVRCCVWSKSVAMSSGLYLKAPILTQRRRKCTDQHAPSSDPPCATQRAGSHGRWYWRKRAGVTVQNDVKAIVPGVVPCDVAVASVGVREMVVVVAVVVIAPLMLRVQCIERGRRRAAAARPIRQT